MKDNKVWVGLLVAGAIVLFGVGLFLIGDKHKAFTHRTDFYAEFTNLSGIAKGAKVRVSGMDGGEVSDVQIPPNPSQKFRVKLTVDDRLRGLIREDSIASVETAGVVGDQFLSIKSGSESSAESQPGATLRSKEPFDLSKMMDRANGIIDQVSGTITHVNGTLTDVQGRLDGALDSVTTTVKNTNGIVTDVRRGKGSVGALLEDAETEDEVKQTVENTRQATANLKTASDQVNQMLNDVQQRQLITKVDDAISNAENATQQLNQTSQQINSTLKTAFAEDQYGQNAGANLQQTLSNVNAATGNLADDTEALKHEFFFKGFFKKRGYDNLDQIPVSQYRSGQLFRKAAQSRQWIAANELFRTQPDGTEILSAAGRVRLDDAVTQMKDLYASPIIIEGYAEPPTVSQQLLQSRQRATLVRTYLEIRYHLAPKQAGIVGLSEQPPTSAGKQSWDGVCLVTLSPTS